MQVDLFQKRHFNKRELKIHQSRPFMHIRMHLFLIKIITFIVSNQLVLVADNFLF